VSREAAGLVLMYLAAIVAANVTFGIWGMAVEPWVSMMLIGLDLTSRDRLHELWGGRRLVPKMAALILTGSVLSAWLGALFAEGVVRIAVASALAFGATATADGLVFGVLPRRWLRVNGSNVVGALVDSFVFPTVAFGEVDWYLVLYFAAVKAIGGAVWWLVLGGWRDVAPARRLSS
jgi:queuosine precursor transporter